MLRPSTATADHVSRISVFGWEQRIDCLCLLPAHEMCMGAEIFHALPVAVECKP